MKNKLLKILNQTYGFEHIKKSSVKKLKQYFDDKTDEHIFIIEYRVVRDMNPKKTEHQKHKQRRIRNSQVGQLLRDINSDVVSKYNRVE